jgi:hypothetical protein
MLVGGNITSKLANEIRCEPWNTECVMRHSQHVMLAVRTNHEHLFNETYQDACSNPLRPLQDSCGLRCSPGLGLCHSLLYMKW